MAVAAAEKKEDEEEKLPSLKAEEKVKEYTVKTKLGEGGYGAVYEVEKKGRRYAMKTESVKEALQTLKMEVLVLQALEARQAKHACRMIEGGQTDIFRYVIMTMVGSSLQSLRKERRSQCFTLPTALRTGAQCLEGIKDMHDAGFLHRDIKPGNFAIGLKTGNHPEGPRTIYLLDFGIARKFLDEAGEVRKPRKRAGFRGTLRYAPLACHHQKELGRKDDLETWLYMLVEMTVGRVPWRELTTKEEVGRAKKAAREKENSVKDALFYKCPKSYAPLLELIDNTPLSAAPDYDRVQAALTFEMTAANVDPDSPFDWEVENKRTATTQRPKSKDVINVKKSPSKSKDNLGKGKGKAKDPAKSSNHP